MGSQELVLHQSQLEAVGPNGIVLCPPNMVCTFPLTEGGNICDADEGGPLFIAQCNSQNFANRMIQLRCLYGIASHYKNFDETSEKVCDGGSYFVSIVFYR